MTQSVWLNRASASCRKEPGKKQREKDELAIDSTNVNITECIHMH